MQFCLHIRLWLLPSALSLALFLFSTEGVASVSHAERGAAGKSFYFTVLNVFIGVTIGGTLFNTFKEIQQEPNSIVEILASSIPQNPAFFISYGFTMFKVSLFVVGLRKFEHTDIFLKNICRCKPIHNHFAHNQWWNQSSYNSFHQNMVQMRFAL
ncbi:hypothetical protein G4B88_010668 [Cannabis sativa]|uniref:CSC1/OSCA1-like 7TM region domain-containing protein n=1 Tax=Cannabis sativa TaxID=3483 RepID=A0A7J6EQG6_CANSA|nr:hypothetical protein G4B88_010668 [Cannabis sativa]